MAFATLCVLRLRLDQAFEDAIVRIECGDRGAQEIDLARNEESRVVVSPAILRFSELADMGEALLRTVATDDGITVLLLGPLEGEPELQVAVMRGSKVAAKLNTCARRLPYLLGAPRGIEICLWSDARLTAQAAVLADGKTLPRRDIADDEQRDGAAIRTDRFELPDSLFDGTEHVFVVAADDGSAVFEETLTWQTDRAFVPARITEYLNWGHVADCFPPHEIERVASFLLSAERPKLETLAPLEQATRNSPVDHVDVPCNLFILHLTGAGAIATATRVRVAEALGGVRRTYAVLPSTEAIEFTAEVGRASALTQQVTTISLSRLKQQLQAIPDDESVIILPGGAQLTDDGATLMRAANGNACVAAMARTMSLPGWRVEVQSAAPTLDLLEACAILPAAAARTAIVFGESQHDDATILTATISDVSLEPIARQIVRQMPGQHRPLDFRIVIDAQQVEDFDEFEARLVTVLELSPNCAVIGPRQLLLRLKENPTTVGVNGLISTTQTVPIDDSAAIAGLVPMPTIYLAAKDLSAALSIGAVELKEGLVFALRQTAQASEGRAFARTDGKEDIDEASKPLFTFRCTA